MKPNNTRRNFADMCAFVAVAERKSFSRAASDLGLTKATMSQTISALEDRLGLRLLNRTTRSVALTEVGERLLARVKPILNAFEAGIAEVEALRDIPAGRLRLKVVPTAAHMIVAPLLPKFHEAYPEISIEIAISHDHEDLVGGHFDAGIRLGFNIGRDMIAVRLSPDVKPVIVASKDYFSERPKPQVPADLKQHNCIPLRLPDGTFSRWRFIKEGAVFDLTIAGSPVVDSAALGLECALNGLGIGYLHPFWGAGALKQGALISVLGGWTARQPGFHLYFPARRQRPSALVAFVTFMKTYRTAFI